MENSQINRTLEILLLQAASEAFLRRTGEAGVPQADVRARLIEGNTHVTRLMTIQADASTHVATGYDVLAQYLNVPDLAGGSNCLARFVRAIRAADNARPSQWR